MKVTSEINPVLIDGKKPTTNEVQLLVESSNFHDLVTLNFNGVNISVKADALKKAIDNAQNS